MPQLPAKCGESAFSHAGPAGWNALPEDLRAVSDSVLFRKRLKTHFLVHGQVTIIFVVSVCLSVCFVCAEFFSAVFDPISIKLGHMLYVCV